jgi:hypothetical protein
MCTGPRRPRSRWLRGAPAYSPGPAHGGRGGEDQPGADLALPAPRAFAAVWRALGHRIIRIGRRIRADLVVDFVRPQVDLLVLRTAGSLQDVSVAMRRTSARSRKAMTARRMARRMPLRSRQQVADDLFGCRELPQALQRPGAVHRDLPPAVIAAVQLREHLVQQAGRADKRTHLLLRSRLLIRRFGVRGRRQRRTRRP